MYFEPSAICAAFDNGIKSIIPVPTLEDALEYKKKGFLVGAERKGQIVEGFDFGNSPYSYMKEEFRGKSRADHYKWNQIYSRR